MEPTRPAMHYVSRRTTTYRVSPATIIAGLAGIVLWHIMPAIVDMVLALPH